MKAIRALLTLVLCAGILYGAWWGVNRILATEPKAQREGATRKSAMLVELTEAHAGTYRPEIVVLGRVRPAREVRLQPEVAGRVVDRAEGFSPGGLVEEGEVLLELEDADYEHALRQRTSAWEQAKADLQVELGRQNVARRDYEMLEAEGPGRLDEEQKRLALREPQAEAARARVASAKAAMDQAALDVSRTKVRAPFDAQVLTRGADIGSRVSPGEDLGHLAGTGTYWVVASVPLQSLRWIEFSGGKGPGAAARIRNRAAWPEDVYRAGRVLRLVGRLEPETRLAQVLVEIHDPLALQPESEDAPALILDAIVEVRIETRPLEDVVELEREFLRMDDTLWTMEPDDTLRVREVDVVFRNATHAYIRSGIEPGARIVATNLATVVEGAALRTVADGEAADETAPEEPEVSDAGASGAPAEPPPGLEAAPE